jgi:hypothetical protein
LRATGAGEGMTEEESKELAAFGLDIEPDRSFEALLEALLLWFVFTVLITLLPLAGSGLYELGQGHPISLMTLAGHGELLIVSVAILGAALGEILKGDKGSQGLLRKSLISLAIIVILAGVWWFAEISVLLQSKQSVDVSFITTWSAWILVAAVIVGGCCITASEKDL